MELKAGFKNTEVGVIPEDWEDLTFKDISWVNQGLQIPISQRLILPNKNSKVYITIQYLNDGKTVEYIDDYSDSVCCGKEDVLMTRTGNTGIVVSGVEGVFHNNFFKINFNREKIDKDFLIYYLNQSKTKRIILAKAGTSTIPDLNHRDFYSIPIPLPPTKAEQTAIATALSDADALINSLEKLIAKKRNIKQGAMQQLLKPKEGWEVRKLGEIAEIYTGKKNNQDKVENGVYPFFVRSQTIERIDSYSFDGEAILIPGEGNIGKIFHYINGKFDYHQRVYKVSDFKEGYFGKYIYRYISEYFGRHAMENSVKATVDSLRLPTFQVFEIPFPPTYKEQVEIATILSDMDAEIQALETKLEKYRNIKVGMMQNLLTGKIRLV